MECRDGPQGSTPPSWLTASAGRSITRRGPLPVRPVASVHLFVVPGGVDVDRTDIGGNAALGRQRHDRSGRGVADHDRLDRRSPHSHESEQCSFNLRDSCGSNGRNLGHCGVEHGYGCDAHESVASAGISLLRGHRSDSRPERVGVHSVAHQAVVSVMRTGWTPAAGRDLLGRSLCAPPDSTPTTRSRSDPQMAVECSWTVPCSPAAPTTRACARRDTRPAPRCRTRTGRCRRTPVANSSRSG